MESNNLLKSKEEQITKIFNRFYARKSIQRNWGWQDIYLNEKRNAIDPFLYANISNISVRSFHIINCRDTAGIALVHLNGRRYIFLDDSLTNAEAKYVLSFLLGYFYLSGNIYEEVKEYRVLHKFRREALTNFPECGHNNVLSGCQTFAEKALLPEYYLRRDLDSGLNEDGMVKKYDLGPLLIKSALRKL